MLDEEMDHIIREAAENHHPAYSDTAWDKMEKMLGKQLPQKKDRRRPLLFLLLFLLMGGGAFFTIYQFTGNKSAEAIAEHKTTEQRIDEQTGKQKPRLKNNSADLADSAVVQDNNITGELEEEPLNTSGKPVIHPGTGSNKSNITNRIKNKKKVLGSKSGSKMRITAAEPSSVVASNNEEGPGNTGNKIQVKKKSDGKKSVVITAAVPEKEENNDVVSVPGEIKKEASVKEEEKKPEQKKEEVKKTEEVKDTKLVVTAEKPSSSPEKKKSKKNPAANFGITVSTGPDVSFVELSKLGKGTVMYGAGLSYSFAKRVTVRTGFYTSNKIYDAAPDKYHNPGGNYPYLYNVAAECKVYEIPVSLSYNFGQRKNHSWFGGAGLSSFLMKSEYYDYQYKMPGGQTYNYARTIRDENKHYFSVLTLSAGYQYKLGKRVWLQAEPYVKIPLGGVGIGKVKLNSSGILFTVTIKPFAKKE